MENNYDNFKEENFLSGKDKKNSFALPEAYFDSLSNRIMIRIVCEQELAEFKHLSEQKQQNFNVPANYFLNLTEHLEYKYELLAYSSFGNLQKRTFKTPLGYFETLDKKVKKKMEQESELKDFAMLSSIPKKNSFKTTAHYFESSADSVKEKANVNEHSNTIFRQLLVSLFQPKMAIAAGFLLIVGFAAFWYYDRKEIKPVTGDCMTLACLEKNEILNDKNIRDFDDESLYEMVDVEALDQQLSTEKKLGDSLKSNIIK